MSSRQALSAASELVRRAARGDVIREDNNVYGGAVNTASRICGLSASGEIRVGCRAAWRDRRRVEFEIAASRR
jgi:class 3 adenylate cyclase